jgi:hypothetical protein
MFARESSGMLQNPVKLATPAHNLLSYKAGSRLWSELSFHLYPNPCSNIQQSKKIRTSMNIMCVTCNKSIFYDFFIECLWVWMYSYIVHSNHVSVEDLNIWLRILIFGFVGICFP